MEKTMVSIELDDYAALVAVEARVQALHDLIVTYNTYMTIDEILTLLGFEDARHE